MPLYAQSINMMEGPTNEEVDQYLEENPKIVPLFEIDVAEIIAPYIIGGGNRQAIKSWVQLDQ